MAWKTPKIIEVAVGLEINMYASASLKKGGLPPSPANGEKTRRWVTTEPHLAWCRDPNASTPLSTCAARPGTNTRDLRVPSPKKLVINQHQNKGRHP